MSCKIGEKICLLRLQNKMTQEQLADHLGVSYQSVSRWENGVTYPDIEFLPAIAKYFSVTVDHLLGQDEEEKKKEIRKEINRISSMTLEDEQELIDLIRLCRREQEGEYFADICYALLYSPLHKNKAVLDELRKSKDRFFEICWDTGIRARALENYAKLEEESHLKGLLDAYATDMTTCKDYLLKERYLFRDEFDRAESARQRHFHKLIVSLLESDLALWRDVSKPLNPMNVLYINGARLAILHSLCGETPTEDYPITCGGGPDVFAEQRIYVGLWLVCGYAATGDTKKAYAVLEDVVGLIEAVMKLPDGAALSCQAPALQTLRVIVKDRKTNKLGPGKIMYYILENGEEEEFAVNIFPQTQAESLTTADYSRWVWLEPIRKEQRFADILGRLNAVANK